MVILPEELTAEVKLAQDSIIDPTPLTRVCMPFLKLETSTILIFAQEPRWRRPLA